MGPREDILALQKRQQGAGASASTYDPRSTSLLQSQLKKIKTASDPKAMAQATKIAKGGGGNWATRALGDTLSGVGIPLRMLVATIEDTAEGFTGKRDKRSWLQNVRDPTYGAGRVVERVAPNLPWAVKSGLGFAGDVALDPLTYLTFGVSPAIEAAGKSGGLARIALQGSRYADEIAKVAEVAGHEADSVLVKNIAQRADELRAIATKSQAGKALTDEELRHVEKATQFMASDPRGVVKEAVEGAVETGRKKGLASRAERMFGTPYSEMSKGKFAGIHALEDESLRYGIRAHLPFSERGVMIPGTAEFGRAMSETGAKISSAVGQKTAKAFGGQLAGVKAALRSGETDLVEGATALSDAVRRGRAAKSSVERAAGEAAGKAIKTLEDAGIDGTELTRILGERPAADIRAAEPLAGMTPGGVASGGEAWRQVIEQGDPRITAALHDVADFYDSVPEGTIDAARAQGVERQFIGDAANRGRTAYVPRVLSDEFKDWLKARGRGAGQRLRPPPGEESWFMKKALSVGEKIGEGDTARELVKVGDVTDLYPNGAPALETQIDDALGALYGDAKVPWYEPDFYKAHEKYVQGLGHQVESQTVQNTLLARGVSRPTLSAALEDAVQPSLWREDLFGKFDPAKGGRTSYSGKVLNQVAYGRLQEMLRQGDSAVLAVNNQFLGDVDAIVVHVDQQLAQLGQQIDEFGGKITDAHLESLIEQETKWNTARDLWDRVKTAEQVGDPNAEHLRLDASRAQIEAAIHGHNAMWDVMTKDKTFIDKMSKALSSGYEGYGFGRQAPSEVVGLLKDIASTYGSSDGAINTFLTKHYDPINHWMKGWLTTSPGFLERNIFGGTFNNWLANVRNPAATTIKVGKLLRSQQRSYGEEAFHDILDHAGILNSGFFTSDLGADPGGRLLDLGHGPSRAWSLNPAAGMLGGEKQPVLPFMNRRLNERFVEPMLRGTLAYDRVTKAVERGRFASLGIRDLEDITSTEMANRFVQEVRDSGLMDEILADVAKYHFDYEDLNRFERQVGRRIIPFYTWTRKNIPLQLEAMFTKPGRTLAAYGHVKRNLESATPQQDVVPQWFGTAGLARLPWQDEKGQKYGGVDLPFKDVFDALDVTGQGLGMISPLVKAPIETRMGSQFFGDLPLRDESQVGGLKPMPTTWKWMVPMLMAADKVPFSPLHAPVKGKGGQWFMREDDNYLVQQYLPFMAQAQRLFPLEEGKYRNRLMSTWVSYMMGVQLRTNTPQDMENEVFRRSDQLSSVVNRLKATGSIPTTTTQSKRRPGKPLSEVLASLNAG